MLIVQEPGQAESHRPSNKVAGDDVGHPVLVGGDAQNPDADRAGSQHDAPAAVRPHGTASTANAPGHTGGAACAAVPAADTALVQLSGGAAPGDSAAAAVDPGDGLRRSAAGDASPVTNDAPIR